MKESNRLFFTLYSCAALVCTALFSIEAQTTSLQPSQTSPVGSEITIISTPDTAAVFFNSDSLSTTPCRLFHVKPGFHTIRIMKSGYIPFLEHLYVQHDTIIRIHAAMEPLHEPVASDTSLTYTFIDKNADNQHFDGRIHTTLPQMYMALAKNCPTDVVHRIAVLPFSSSKASHLHSQMVAEAGIDFFSKEPHFRLVDRTSLSTIMKELNLSNSDLSCTDKLLQTGKIIAAEYIVSGTVVEAGGEMHVYSRITRVETGEILSTTTALLVTETITKSYPPVMLKLTHPM
ncbi:MAG: PEGA domain-containing protein [Chitinivibrionales bacterium]|nr:PEGA domain-containing protein [Chitinivibrionales bacterium]